MRALAVHSDRQGVEPIDDHPAPAAPGPREVRLRMLEVGLCGTDREIASLAHGSPPPGERRLVLGHEGLGEVEEAGAEVTTLRPGDLAVPMVRRPCDDPGCRACRAGRQDFCYTGRFTERGIKGAHGFMTEHIVDEERFLVKVPPAARRDGVLTEPLSIAEKSLIQIFEIQERLPWACAEARRRGDAPPLRALVLGAGPIGLLGAMTLVRAGFEVTLFSRGPQSDPRAQIVRDIGAIYLSGQDHAPGDLPAVLGAIDVVYEAAGASKLAFEVLEVLGPNAVFVFTGVPGRKAPVEIDAARVMQQLVLNNQVVFGTVNAGRDAYEAAVEDLALFRARWPAALDALFDTKLDLAEVPDLLEGERASAVKPVVALG